jgi:GcrA cell cycle regulator
MSEQFISRHGSPALIWESRPELDNRLTELHKITPQLSFTQIAKEMSGEFDLRLSRNAVIGRAHRIGLPARSVVNITRRPRKPKLVKLIRSMPIKDFKPIEPICQQVPDNEGRMDLLSLTIKTCKYPFGDRAPYRFCGGCTSEDTPYCAEHIKLTYREPPPPRSRASYGIRSLDHSW